MLEIILAILSVIGFVFRLAYALVVVAFQYPAGILVIVMFFVAVAQYTPEKG